MENSVFYGLPELPRGGHHRDADNDKYLDLINPKVSSQELLLQLEKRSDWQDSVLYSMQAGANLLPYWSQTEAPDLWSHFLFPPAHDSDAHAQEPSTLLRSHHLSWSTPSICAR